ncbi:MAG: hypothetical protein K8R76_13330 [Candidatus Aegiribacteria sp.]|nr:hypothetical protein [Candidatus Aegiribacteria sp.]
MKYDMNEYRDKLSSLNMVQENHIPYMTGWVKHFLVLGNPDDAEFADILCREGREDWQIRQALDAVKIYRGMYPVQRQYVLPCRIASLNNVTER